MDRHLIQRVLLVLAAALVLGLAGCQAQGETSFEASENAASPGWLPGCQGGETLAFETLTRGDHGRHSSQEPEEPAVLVASDAAQAQALLTTSDQVRESLGVLDYQRELALAVYQGRKMTAGYGVEILCITREGSVVTVHASFREPRPGEGVSEAITDPYHLVRVERDGLQGEIEFLLYIYMVDKIVHVEDIH